MNSENSASDDLAFARALSDAEATAVLEFDSKYRPVILHAFNRAFARWRPSQPVEADDYVQDFIGFLFDDQGRRLRTYSGRARFTTWLSTVALRYFQRQFSKRSRDRRGHVTLALVPDLDTVTPEDHAAQVQSVSMLKQAIAGLPEHEQLCLKLFYVDGLNATDVALATGQSKSAIRMRKMRILDKLRVLLEDGGG
ncbi:MAG: sigma-70 family RNA polymerase sigma factor [Myxococcota bacterium]|nr:sigma-70 family RNA polymerase sigma factor [Myxococcota bacterium]